jgi:hypothetical protein
MRSFTNTLASARRFIDAHRLSTIIITSAVGIATVLNATFLVWPAPLQDIADSPVRKPKPTLFYSPLTGLEVKSHAATKKPVTAIIIENSTDARPQSGLKAAEVVYEAIAEGGITRLLAIYQQNKPQLIGPVRSVRSYHPDWVRSYNASIAHVGGSARALKEIRSGKYRDIDQFFNDGTYWRASDRYAPHNVYTSFKRIDALNKQKKYTKSSPKPFDREDSEPAKKITARKVSVTVSSAPYNSTYRYNKKTNTYTRSQGGAVHKDREKGAITPTVVIALNVKERTVMEETWRERITTLGSGKATIFQNGVAIKATWKKAKATDQLSFYDSKGEKIKLARGQTWITAVPNGKGSVSWKK